MGRIATSSVGLAVVALVGCATPEMPYSDAATVDAPGDAPPVDARADAPWDAPDDARDDAAPTDAELAIAIVDAPDPATVGLPLMFQVTLTNNGPAAATSVFFELQTDPTVAITGMPAGCTSISQGFQCAVGVMASGAVRTFDATAVPGSAGAGRETRVTLFNANEPDPLSGNNTATATTTVDPPPCPRPGGGRRRRQPRIDVTSAKKRSSSSALV